MRSLRQHTERIKSTISLLELEIYILFYNNKREMSLINTVIREHDSRVYEINYFQNKFSNDYYRIYMDTRQIITSTLKNHQLKCLMGFNYHRTREKMLNKYKTDKCDFCTEPET